MLPRSYGCAAQPPTNDVRCLRSCRFPARNSARLSSRRLPARAPRGTLSSSSTPRTRCQRVSKPSLTTSCEVGYRGTSLRGLNWRRSWARSLDRHDANTDMPHAAGGKSARGTSLAIERSPHVNDLAMNGAPPCSNSRSRERRAGCPRGPRPHSTGLRPAPSAVCTEVTRPLREPGGLWSQQSEAVRRSEEPAASRTRGGA